ncbi:hypothetical protein TGAM01_v202112 [Trichoderma gamsii]|uniref:Uncharacterized protein n=1 Tax=Trichoderma gamsii TaxID=398673 RepID=A0A2P4ZXH9_9HYPO|nr:hypothetical protein TGAM01_v202112 [Trichoderma gamsii]PON29004.1 hypothetical protein TGAM01_v202112 [Trichoderma gamsii]
MAFKSCFGNLRPWTTEILAMASSIILLIAMAALLAAFNHKPIFDDKIWTLNALISTLSTASKACLLAAVASCISQENWVLFSEKPRRLYDFELISGASRGPFGSFKVLTSFKLRGGGLVRLGALATILSLAMDPFSQQLVQLHNSQDRRVDEASIAYASRYSQGTLVSGLTAFSLTKDGHLKIQGADVYANADFGMQAAVAFGLAADADAVMEQASFHCPGVECDFKPLESLSVCSQCSDVTDKLKKNTLSTGDQYSNLQYDPSVAEAQANCTEYRLPNGLYLNNMDHKYGPSSSMVYMSMLGTSDTDKTVAMKHLDTLIWSQTVIKVNADPSSKSTTTWPDFKVNASECALYYCTRRYEGDYKIGFINITSTELKDQKRNPQSWEPLDPRFQSGHGVAEKVVKSLAYDPQESIIRRTDLQLGTATGWNVSDEAVYGISYYMQTLFADCLNNPKNCTQAVESWGVPNGFYISKLSNFSGEEKQAEQFRPSVAKVLWETDDIEQVFDNIAASMSNAIRRGADGGQTEKGDVLQPTTVYVVAWPWIILHAAIELGGLVLLVLIIRSSGSNTAHIWKSSELAVLSKGVALGDAFKEAHTKDELEERAKNIPTVLVSKHELGKVEGSSDFLLTDQRNVA